MHSNVYMGSWIWLQGAMTDGLTEVIGVSCKLLLSDGVDADPDQSLSMGRVSSNGSIPGLVGKISVINKRSSAVAERLRDASCLSVVSFNIPTARFFITSYCGFRFTSA